MTSLYWQAHSVEILGGLLGLFFTAFVVFLVLYLVEILSTSSSNGRVNIETWTGFDLDMPRYFGLNHLTQQFVTFAPSFQTIGAVSVDVSSDFTATIPSDPPMVIEWQVSPDPNVASIVLQADSPARRRIDLTRLSLQSLLPAFNATQDTVSIPTLFNPFY